MNLITDRTRADVMAGNEKGRYTPRDLDRVEQTVEKLCKLMGALDIPLDLTVYTNWQKTRNVPTAETMERYLHNVRILAQRMGLTPQLPESMENLDYQGANRIELALQMAQDKIQGILGTFQMSGELSAGEENEL